MNLSERKYILHYDDERDLVKMFKSKQDKVISAPSVGQGMLRVLTEQLEKLKPETCRLRDETWRGPG